MSARRCSFTLHYAVTGATAIRRGKCNLLLGSRFVFISCGDGEAKAKIHVGACVCVSRLSILERCRVSKCNNGFCLLKLCRKDVGEMKLIQKAVKGLKWNVGE